MREERRENSRSQLIREKREEKGKRREERGKKERREERGGLNLTE